MTTETLNPAASSYSAPGSAPNLSTTNRDTRSLSLAANFRWALVGNGVYAFCQWAMLAVLALMGSPVAVGQFGLGLAIASPVAALAMLQLRNVQVTDTQQKFRFADYFGTRIVWTVIGLVIIIVWGVMVSDDRTTLWVVVLVGLMKSVDSLSDIVRGFFQSRERMDLNGISMMTKGILSVIALGLTMTLTGSVVAAVAAATVAWAMAFVVYDLVVARRILGEGTDSLRPAFRVDVLRRLTWIALPLGLVMAMISLQTNIPRYVLESHSGTKLLGFFIAIVYPMMAGMMVTTALGQSASPRLARYFDENMAAFVRLLLRLSAISAGLAVLLIAGSYALGEWALRILYGPEYAEYHREFFVVAVAWGIQLVSSCWGYGLTAARCFRVQVVLTALSCVATLAASILLIPQQGVMGAALAVLVTSLTVAIGYSLTMYWVIRTKRG